MPNRRKTAGMGLQWAAAAAVMVVGVLLAVFLLLSGRGAPGEGGQELPEPYTSGCLPGTPEGFTALSVEPGQFGWRLNTGLRFAPGAQAWLLAENPAENEAALRVLIKDEQGDTLCDTGLIPPGYYLPAVSLRRALMPGAYAATAYLVRYTADTFEQREVFTQAVTVTVLE